MVRRNRVVVTGIGILAANGTGIEPFWKSLLAGESGIGPITHFDASRHATRIAGEVKNFKAMDYFPKDSKPQRMARHTQLGFAAAKMAVHDAHVDLNTARSVHSVPVIIGVSTSGLDVIERGFEQLGTLGPGRVSPYVVSYCQPQALSSLIAQMLAVPVRASTISAACVSGIEAIATAASLIANGEADIAVAGGADAPVTSLTVASFGSSGMSSTSRNSDPGRANRPFDDDAEGGMMAEGAGILVLENKETAQARGAHIYLELGGYAAETDSDTNDPASGLEHTMRMALANAGKDAAQINYLCAYGPGDRVLDAAETAMIKRVFGRHAYSLPISSIKGVTGNPLAAAGPFQIVTCALAFRDQTIPPTANCERAGEACDLDYVPGGPRRAKLDCAIINVRGLGGGSASMVVERVCPG